MDEKDDAAFYVFTEEEIAKIKAALSEAHKRVEREMAEYREATRIDPIVWITPIRLL